MTDKPLEYWAAIVGMAIYTATKKAETAPLKHRIAKTLSSGLLTFALSPWVHEKAGISEVTASVVSDRLEISLSENGGYLTNCSVRGKVTFARLTQTGTSVFEY